MLKVAVFVVKTNKINFLKFINIRKSKKTKTKFIAEPSEQAYKTTYIL